MPNIIASIVAGAAIATFAAGGASAENWYPFYMRPSGATYMDKDSVILRPGHVSVRTEFAYPDVQQLLRKGKVFVYKQAKDLIDIDCKANVYRVIARDLYSDIGVLQISINDADDPLIISPDSPQAALATAYCPTAR